MRATALAEWARGGCHWGGRERGGGYREASSEMDEVIPVKKRCTRG